MHLVSNKKELFDVGTGSIESPFDLSTWMHVHEPLVRGKHKIQYFGVENYIDNGCINVVEKTYSDKVPRNCWWFNKTSGHMCTASSSEEKYWLFYNHSESKLYIHSNENHCETGKVFIKS